MYTCTCIHIRICTCEHASTHNFTALHVFMCLYTHAFDSMNPYIHIKHTPASCRAPSSTSPLEFASWSACAARTHPRLGCPARPVLPVRPEPSAGFLSLQHTRGKSKGGVFRRVGACSGQSSCDMLWYFRAGQSMTLASRPPHRLYVAGRSLDLIPQSLTQAHRKIATGCVRIDQHAMPPPQTLVRHLLVWIQRSALREEPLAYAASEALMQQLMSVVTLECDAK